VNKKMKDDNGLMRMIAVGGTYIAAKKLIDRSESADTRQWNLLPAGIQVGGAKFSAGSYEVRVKANRNGKEIWVDLGKVDLSEQKSAVLKTRIVE